MGVISEITGRNDKPIGIVEASDELVQKLSHITNNEMDQRIDTVIFESIGQSMTFSEVLQKIKTTDPAAYDCVIGYAQQILNPTYVLS